MNKHTKKIITTSVGLLLSAVFLYLAFRQIEFDQLWASLRGMNYLYAIPFCLVTWLSFYWRTLRWQVLLRPTHPRKTWPLFGPLMVGFGFNNVFPARAGEFARPLALMKTEKIPFTTGFSTVFVERVLDIMTLLALFAVLPYFIDFTSGVRLQIGDGVELSPEFLRDTTRGLSVFFAVLLAGSALILFDWFRRLVVRMINGLPLLPDGFKSKVCELFDHFANGFVALRNPRLLFLGIFHSVVVWVMTGASIWLMAMGAPDVELTMATAMAFLTITCIAISIPSAPGFWGLYEVGGQFALVLVGVVANTPAGLSAALGFTLVVHFFQWALTTAIGFYYAARIHISPSEAPTGTEAIEAAPDQGPDATPPDFR